MADQSDNNSGWQLTPKGTQLMVTGGSPTQTGASSESGAAQSFGLAKAPGEDNDAYAKNYASDNAIH